MGSERNSIGIAVGSREFEWPGEEDGANAIAAEDKAGTGEEPRNELSNRTQSQGLFDLKEKEIKGIGKGLE